MHSTAVGVGASSASIQSTNTDGLKMVHNNDDAMNKIPLKSSNGLDDEEKNGGEFIHDTAAAEEARREQMRANLLKWMKKLTIVLICFIGIALIGYVIISLCISDWQKPTNTTNSTRPLNASSLLSDNNSNDSTNNRNASSFVNNTNNKNINMAAIGISDKLSAATTSTMPPSMSTANEDDDTSTLKMQNTNTAPSSSSSSSSSSTAAVIASDTILSTTLASSTINSVKSTTAPMNGDASEDVATTIAMTKKKNMLNASGTLLHDQPITDAKFQSKLGIYDQAAICSDKEVCSQIGRHILEKDGSAVDSAIATLLCNGIVNMHSLGIGGGMLMNVYIKEKQHAYAIDAREVAPFAAYPEMFENNVNQSLFGGLSIAVPGELMGYHRAHERFGKLPWAELVEPSIKLCNEGFYMSQHLHNSILRKRKSFSTKPVLPAVFLNAETGDIHPVGTKLKPQKELCQTYQLLADNGPMDFYNGTLAKLVVEDLEELNSTITSYDLESYFADLVSSITMQLGDDILYAVPPVSSGIIVANILSVLEGYNFTKADLIGLENEANTIHRFAEAMKFAFAKRWELGDLRFNDVRELVSKLTNPESAKEVRNQINDSTVLNDIYDYGAQFMGADDYGTSHAVVFAPNGDVVSVTSSVNYYFGSNLVGKRTGIVFNNGMSDFSIPGHEDLSELPPAPSNFVDARKRSMSSMSPMILADQKGNVKMAVGAAGGSKIISSVVEVMARVLWFNDDIKSAIDAPRFHHQLLPNFLYYQKDGFSDDVLVLLTNKGHKIKSYNDIGSVVCGIVRNETAIYANADYRKQGGIAGF